MKKKTVESFYILILRVLKEMGGEGRRSEVITRIAQKRKFTNEEMEELTPSGESVIENNISWARMCLVNTGYLQPTKQSGHGKWALSEMGHRANLESVKPGSITRDNKSQGQPIASAPPKSAGIVKRKVASVPDEDKYRKELLAKLRKLTPHQFELVCKRLLEEMGLVNVTLTKRSRDGGFDGWGYLEINPLVKSKIIFECKRFKTKPVPVGVVRDLQSAVDSRQEAERGVIITTSRFTSDAINTSASGKTSIELINGDALADLFVKYELGVKTVYTVDNAWFFQFANETSK